MEAPPAVFISHASKDKEEIVEIIRKLEDYYYVKVWVSYRDIVAGEWDREIENALNSATHVVVIASEASIESSYVRAEVEYALDNDKTVIPVKIERVRLPLRWHTLQNFDLTEGNPNIKVFNLSEALPKAEAVRVKYLINLLKKSNDSEEIYRLLLEPSWLITHFIRGSFVSLINTPSRDSLDVYAEITGSRMYSSTIMYFCSISEPPLNSNGLPSSSIQDKLNNIPKHREDIAKYLPNHYSWGDYAGTDFLRMIYVVSGRTSHYTSSLNEARLKFMLQWHSPALEIISYDYLYQQIAERMTNSR